MHAWINPCRHGSGIIMINEGPKVRINDKMVKWSAKRNNRGRFSATRGAENLRRHGS